MRKSHRHSTMQDIEKVLRTCRFVLGCALVAAILLTCARAYGQDSEPELPDVSGACAPELTAPRRAVLEHEGYSGIWFRSELAKCMLGRLQALPEYASYAKLLERRLSLSDDRTALLRRQVSLAERQAEEAEGALQAAERGRRRAEEELSAWHRSRALWAAVGAVVAGALVALAAYGLSAVGD